MSLRDSCAIVDLVPDDGRPFGFSVYALADETVAEIRYIGQTVDIEGRIKGHLIRALGKRNDPSDKSKWIREVVAASQKIAMIEIERTSSRTECDERERYYINLFRSLGNRLTNTAPGGFGGQAGSGGWKFSDETRRRMSESAKRRPPKSPEHRARIAATLRGRKLPKEVCAKISAGLMRSERFKAAMAKPRPQERIERMRASLRSSEKNKAVIAMLAELKRGKKRSVESRIKQIRTWRAKRRDA